MASHEDRLNINKTLTEYVVNSETNWAQTIIVNLPYLFISDRGLRLTFCLRCRPSFFAQASAILWALCSFILLLKSFLFYWVYSPHYCYYLMSTCLKIMSQPIVYLAYLDTLVRQRAQVFFCWSWVLVHTIRRRTSYQTTCRCPRHWEGFLHGLVVPCCLLPSI